MQARAAKGTSCVRSRVGSNAAEGEQLLVRVLRHIPNAAAGGDWGRGSRAASTLTGLPEHLAHRAGPAPTGDERGAGPSPLRCLQRW